MSNKILLSISILISNRPDTVEKCLGSLNKLRRKVSCELILIDTGCGEKVRNIIQPYADKIINFQWCNDFAKARNVGLKEAQGEWFMFLDDDEWFDRTTEIELFFESGDYKKYNYATYFVRNYTNMQGTIYSDTVAGRMIKLYPDVEFIYAVHETFSVVRGPVKRLHAFVHHYGYVYSGPEEACKHAMRNITLLLVEHNKNPQELRHTAQLAQEYNTLRDWRKSIEVSEEGIKNYLPNKNQERFLNSLYGNITRGYLALKEYKMAISEGEKFLHSNKVNELQVAVLNMCLCKAYLEENRYQESLQAAQAYLVRFNKWAKNHDIYQKYDGSCWDNCFDKEPYYMTLSNAVHAAICINECKLVKEYFEKIDLLYLEKVIDISQVEMIQEIIAAWLKLPASEATVYTEMLMKLLKNEVTSKVIVTNIEKMYTDNPNLLMTKKADWDALKNKGWLFLCLKLWNHVDYTDKSQLFNEYVELWSEAKDALMRSEEFELWKMAAMDNIDMGRVLSKIGYYRWRGASQFVCENMEWEDLQQLNSHIEEIRSLKEYDKWCWETYYRLRSLTELTQSNLEIPVRDFVKEVINYASSCEKVSRFLYKEELFDSMPELLPVECQVAVICRRMYDEVQHNRYDEALLCVKKALQTAPKMATIFKYCMQWIDEENSLYLREQEKVNHEMLLLAEKIEISIAKMMQQGKYNDAYALLQQLKSYGICDKQLVGLEQQLIEKIGK